ncbi:hypothetical protein HOLleu_21549 [Holothuria leucospilota]|uniref:Uncharacterized protein n=1 Tax=Holothuria leucospilota TaxID=206669 RepID=A0A9Q1H429_HOLLE|nr:hypothetical protein HOLleu_21549 [Holothuria leucospilota]
MTRAVQGILLRGYRSEAGNWYQLLLLRTADCTDLNKWIQNKCYMSNDIINELASLMAREVTVFQLLAKIRQSRFFAITADE